MREFEAELIRILRRLAGSGQLPFRLTKEDIAPQTPLDTLDLDSLSLEVLAMELAERYGIDVPDHFFADNPTLSDLAARLSVARINPGSTEAGKKH